MDQVLSTAKLALAASIFAHMLPLQQDEWLKIEVMGGWSCCLNVAAATYKSELKFVEKAKKIKYRKNESINS